ncbi:MAG: division/cell wall cluster transcriptional repressor MraZ [Desulfobaccales bacterium]
MIEFSGRHFHSMDNKGRVSIPSRYREILVELQDRQLVITNYFQRKTQDGVAGEIHYLRAFPTAAWQEYIEAQKPIFAKNINLRRFITGGKEECPLDRQGRILISPSLRDFAQLSRDLILVGMTNWFEIWDRGVYEANLPLLLDTIDEKDLEASEY